MSVSPALFNILLETSTGTVDKESSAPQNPSTLESQVVLFIVPESKKKGKKIDNGHTNGKEASEISFVDVILLKVNKPVKSKDTKLTD